MPDAPSRGDLDAHEAQAERALAQMYDAGPRDQKDLRDDVTFHLARAIEAAEALGLAAEAARLHARRREVIDTFDSQFRGAWR
jgi:hypothetical protein